MPFRRCFCALAVLGLAGPASASVIDDPHFRVLGAVIVWAADAAGTAPIVSDFVIDTGTGNRGDVSGDVDLLAGDVHTVVSGTLIPADDAYFGGQGAPVVIRRPVGTGNFSADSDGNGLLDANDGFSAFRLRQNTDTNTRRMEIWSSFFVASNEPFNIDAVMTPVNGTQVSDLNRIFLRLSVTDSGNDGIAFGAAAQFPHTAGPLGGSRANSRRLSNMTSPVRVFVGNQRTARVPGSIVDQSVRFDLRYRYHSGSVDLSDGVFDFEAEVLYTVYMP